MESPTPNPYSSPAANLYGAASGAGADAVSPGTIAALAGTKPWVRFMSVMIWIGAIFMLLGGAGMLIMSLVGLNNSTASAAMGAPFGGSAFMMGMAVAYLVMALLYIYPAIKLWSFASNIARLAASRTVADLDAALNEQRRFWKFAGIMVIIMLCLYALFIVAMVVAMGASAFKAGAMH